MSRFVEIDVLVPKTVRVNYGSRGYYCNECGRTESLDYTPEAGVVIDMAEQHLKLHYGASGYQSVLDKRRG